MQDAPQLGLVMKKFRWSFTPFRFYIKNINYSVVMRCWDKDHTLSTGQMRLGGLFCDN